MEALQAAIGDLKNGKSPGPNRFSSRFYKIFSEKLVPFFLEVCNSVSPSCPFSHQSLMAHISVISKPGKDLNQCGSYLPISLINKSGFWYGARSQGQHYLYAIINCQSKIKDHHHVSPLNRHWKKHLGGYTGAFFAPLWNILVSVVPYLVISWHFIRIPLPRSDWMANSPLLSLSIMAQDRVPPPLWYAISMVPLAVALWHKRCYGWSGILQTYIICGPMYVSSFSTTIPIILHEFDQFGLISNFKVNTH